MPVYVLMETEAAARNRRRRTYGYVEERDAATTKVYAEDKLVLEGYFEDGTFVPDKLQPALYLHGKG